VENSKNEEAKSADPFADISKLRLSQDFAATIGVEKVLTKISVSKPDRQSWIRVHKDPKFCFQTAVIELKSKNETYLVSPKFWSQLSKEIIFVMIFTAIDRQGNVFFWKIRLPDSDGKHNEWHKSAFSAASCAMDNWVRVAANQSAKGYDVTKSTAKLEEPEWPDLTFDEMFKIAFKDRFIDSLDHPVLKELRGEI
jgi:hypothetical protein